ncbi:GntR family transcriptional regulator [Glaciihabitans sp. dw_435]|uniref:GntR family transcriptional regulator n=1 Tax=Glaciihabitans sp. dw_435 TaxID=2720081 RepID=UPI001BD55927|nr:GntR family transcriptional regulator [Glaciihabitans sp. dw_435]
MIVTDTPTTSSAERAYLHTKALIVRGDLPGGQLISEGQICEALNISRTPVHEAFLRLAAEQLIVLSSRKGAVVAPISPREAQDVLEMREAIERSAAARIAAEGGPTATTVARLKALLDEQRTAIDRDDSDAFLAADDEFHAQIIAAGNNAIALHLFGQLRDRQQRLRNHLMRTREEYGPVLDEHSAMFARLEASDLDGFVAVLSAHVNRFDGVL